MSPTLWDRIKLALFCGAVVYSFAWLGVQFAIADLHLVAFAG